MPDQVTIEAFSADAARVKAAEKLQILPRQVDLQVLKPGSDGVLGIGRRAGRYLARRKVAHRPLPAQRIADALDIGLDLDGDFIVDYDAGQAVVTVNPPGAKGRAVTVADVLARLAALQIDEQDVDREVLAETVAAASGVPIPVAAWPDAAPLDAFAKVTISPDGGEAYVQVFPPKHGGKMMALEDINRAIARQGINFGLRLDNLEQYLAYGDFSEPILIARGEPPRHGQDAEITYHFKTTPELELKEDDKGRVDFRELGLIQNAAAGSVLAEKDPVTAGTDGTSVRGETIPARAGRDMTLGAGKNTELSPDGLAVRALIDGGVSLVRDAVNIDPIFRVAGDVSMETGNIDFDGSVEILGRVPDGFRVRAQGDIVVGRTVEGAFLEAGGSIYVRGGVLGHTKGRLKAGGEVMVKFAENAHLEAKGAITISELIMHSQTLCEGDLLVQGRRAALIGGKHIVGGEIICKELGAVGGTCTVVQAGITPSLFVEFAKLKDQAQKLHDKKEKVVLAMQTIERSRADNTADAEQERQHEQLAQTLRKLDGQLAALSREEERLQGYVDCRPDAAIHVEDRAYKGGVIIIGAARLTLINDYRYTTFRHRRGKIVFSTYEGPQTVPATKPKKKKKR